MTSLSLPTQDQATPKKPPQRDGQWGAMGQLYDELQRRRQAEEQQAEAPKPAFVPPPTDGLWALAEQMPTSGNQLDEEAWLKQATDAINGWNRMRDESYLQHMAKQGQMRQLIQERAAREAGLDDMGKIQMLGESLQWSPQRLPHVRQDFDQAIQPFLGAADPSVQTAAQDVKLYRDARLGLQEQLANDVRALQGFASSRVVDESRRSFISGPVQEAIAGTFFQQAGGPVERIYARVLEEVEKRAGAYREARERSPAKALMDKHQFQPAEAYRSALLDQAVGAATAQLAKTPVEEGALEEVTRRAFGLVGIPFGGSAILKGVRGITKLTRMATALPKVAKVFEAGGLGTAIYAFSRTGAPGIAPVDKLATATQDQETREKAEHSYALANAVIGATALPVFAGAQRVFEAAKGAGGLIRSPLAMGAGSATLTAGMEGHAKVMESIRGLLDASAPEQGALRDHLNIWKLTHPHAVGSIEKILTGQDPQNTGANPDDVRREGAIALGKELGSGLMYFGAVNALGAYRPALIRLDEWRRAKADVLDSGLDQEVKGQLLKHLDGLKPAETAVDRARERVPDADRKIAERVERDRDRERRMELQRPGDAAEVRTEQKAEAQEVARHRQGFPDDGQAREDQERSQSFDRSKIYGPEEAVKTGDERIDTLLDDVQELRRVAEQASPSERMDLRQRAREKLQEARALRAGQEPNPQEIASQERARAAESELAEQIEEPARQELAAQRLLGQEAEQRDVEDRAQQLDRMVEQAVPRETEPEIGAERTDVRLGAAPASLDPGAGGQSSSAERTDVRLASPSPSLEGVVKPGDVLETTAGEVEVTSVGPDGLEGETPAGKPVRRSSSEALAEGVKLVGKRKRARHPESEGKANQQESREKRAQRMAQKIAAMRRATTEPREPTEQEHQEAQEFARETMRLDQESVAREAEATRETGQLDAPPPGTAYFPEAARPMLRMAQELTRSGMLEKLAKAKNWRDLDDTVATNPRDRSFLEVARRREAFMPANLRGRGRVAQALYDYAREQEGLPHDSETFVSQVARISVRLDAISKLQGPDYARALHGILDDHAEWLSGPWLPVLRTTTQGIALMNKVQAGQLRVHGEMSSEAGKLYVPDPVKLVEGMRAAWNWTSGFGMDLGMLSPRAQVGMVQEAMKRLLAEPDPNLGGIVDGMLRQAGVYWGMPELKLGFVGHKLGLSVNQMAANIHAFVRRMTGKGGLLEGLTPDQSREFFDAAERGSSSDPAIEAKLPAYRDMMKRFRDELVNAHPKTVYLEGEVALNSQRLARAKAMLASAKGRGVGLAKKKVAEIERDTRTVERELTRWRDEWGIETNYVHHVSASRGVTIHDYGVVQRRTGALEAKGDLMRDMVASLMDYGPNAISLIERNKTLRSLGEFLYGKSRLPEWRDLSHAEPGTHATYRGESLQVFGEVYVMPDGYVIPARTRGQDGEWADAEAPDGAKRRIMLYSRLDSESNPQDSRHMRRVPKLTDLNLELRRPNQQTVKLLATNDAMLDVTIRDGGWFDRASRPAANNMKAALERYETGMREMRMGQRLAKLQIGEAAGFVRKAVNLVTGSLAEFGRLSSRLKMVGLGSPMNVLHGGLMMNAMHMSPQTGARASKWATGFFKRYLIDGGRDAVPKLDLFAEVDTPEFWKGREVMKTRPTGKLRDDVNQGFVDEASMLLLRHPSMEHTLLDMDRGIRQRTPKGKTPTAEQVRKMTGPSGWDVALAGVKAADSFARVHNYMGVYVTARHGGKSIREADEHATASVIFNHGMFNLMTEHPLLSSWFGQWQLGLKTYVARQFFVWAAAPAQYKARYAALAMATNYLWRTTGIGDLTNTIGSSFYDLPFIGPVSEDVLLGGEEPLGPDWITRPGTMPFPMPLGRSPVMVATGDILSGLSELAKGNTTAGLRQVARAAQDSLVPPIADSVNRAFLTPGEPGDHDYVPLYQKATDGRVSYTLRHSGIPQMLREFASGTQMEVANSIEARRIREAQRRRKAALREDVNLRLRDAVRRHDDAASRGPVGPAVERATRESMNEIRQRAVHHGIDLQSEAGIRSAVQEARRRATVDSLPGELRTIARAESKEAQVLLLANAIQDGINERDLRKISNVLRGDQPLPRWAMDPARVSPETREKFVAAMQKWRASQ